MLRYLACALLLSAFAVVPVLGVLGQDGEYSRKGADTCLSCHEDAATLALFKTPHAVPGDARGPFGHGQLQCEACHGPGNDHSGRVRFNQERPPVISFASDDATPVAQQNGMCLACHDGDVGIGWHGGSHPVDEVACASCHNSHAARDPVLLSSSQPEVCESCHLRVRTDTRKAFAHPIAQRKMDCTSCHAVHEAGAATDFTRLTALDTCYQCHAETRGPFLWEHAPVSEDCGLCHAPHGSNHPGMLTRRAPLLCQSCHAQSGHPSVLYDTSGLAGEMPSQFLLGQSCLNCHSQVHGSNHPSGSQLMR